MNTLEAQPRTADFFDFYGARARISVPALTPIYGTDTSLRFDLSVLPVITRTFPVGGCMARIFDATSTSGRVPARSTGSVE